MLWIISGPSSIGKSTFIRSDRSFAVTGLRPETPVLKPKNKPGLDPRLIGDTDCFVHYNILRPVSLFAKREATEGTTPERYRTRSTQFNTDPWWAELCERSGDKQAIVMVADRTTILNRASARPDYKIDYWQRLYSKLRVSEIYRAWCSELDRRRIPLVFVDATNMAYPTLDADAAFTIINRNS